MCDNELLMEPCQEIPEDAAPMTGHDLEHMLSNVDEWEVVEGRLTKGFQLEDHFQVMALVNAVAWISHRQDHHPEIVVGYDTVVISYQTDSIGGLSRNDFICAANVDALVSE